MDAQRTPDEAIHEAHQAEARSAPRPPKPEPINVDNAIALFGPVEMTLRGRTYQARRVPFEVGARADLLRHRLEELQGKPSNAENTAAFLGILEEARGLFPRVFRRRGWLRWLPVRPPRDMDEGEVLHCLGFMLACLMIGRLRTRAPSSPAPHR